MLFDLFVYLLYCYCALIAWFWVLVCLDCFMLAVGVVVTVVVLRLVVVYYVVILVDVYCW